MPKKDLSVISLYSGAGGLDLGLEAAGFRIAVAVEMDKDSCATLRHNRPNLPIIEDKVENVSSRSILRTAGLRKREATLLAGGPPCQPFSKSSYWSSGDTKRLDDPRANTLGEYMRILEDTLPEAFLLENVSGLTYKGKDEGLQFLLSRLDEINRKAKTKYKAALRILNAADYGVPQIRERTFLIGCRDGTEFVFPDPSHCEGNGKDLFCEPHRTAWDAIGDLPPDGPDDESLAVGGKWAALLPSIPEGENYLWHTDRKGGEPIFGWRTRYWCFLLKLAKAKPSWTVQAQPGSAIGPFHWTSRKLSKREMLRIQTFPDSYEVMGSRTEVQRQLGNAVPSLLTEVLGRSMREQFFGTRRITRELKLLPPLRMPMPDAEIPDPVADEYLELVGDHAAHPGTGKGPRPFASS